MIQIKINSSAPMRAVCPQTFVAIRAQAATILRLLILTLVGLLFVLLGLMLLTERVEIGGPILGGVLLVGFAATQFDPRRATKTHEEASN